VQDSRRFQRIHGFKETSPEVHRLRVLLRLVVTEPDHEPLATPKLHVVIVNELLGLSEGFAVITAGEALRIYEMAVSTYEIRPVIRHEQRSRHRTHRWTPRLGR
jgi:hypothetical protein